MKRNKKWLSMLLTVSLFATSMLAGCGNKDTSNTSTEVAAETTTDETTTDESNFNEPGVLPICKETVTLTIAIEPSTNVIDYDTNEFTKMLEETANVDLVFEYLPVGESAQKVALLINSGSKLPDIIVRTLGTTGNQYGMDGYFIPITKYIEDPNIAVNYNERMAEGRWDSFIPEFKAADGNYYAMPSVSVQDTNTHAQKIWINQTWLDKYDMDMPTTTEEFKTTMEFFVSNDCNDNGVLDEIGYTSAANGWAAQGYPCLMNGFVYCSEFNQFLSAKDGTIYASYMQDEWRDGLEYMRDLCATGALDSMMFTQDSNQFNTLMKAHDTTVVGAFMGNRPPYDTEDARKAEYVTVPPLEGPDGTKISSITHSSLPIQEFWVTKDCKDPEAAVRLLDLFYSKEFVIGNRYGALDVHTTNHIGEEDATWGNLARTPEYLVTSDVEWGSPQNANWTGVGPKLQDETLVQELLDPELANDPTTGSFITKNLNESITPYVECVPDEVVTNIILTAEENLAISEISASLYSFVKEELAAFVTGTKEINDETWAAFKSECELIGVNEFLEIKQAGYDRMKSK